MSLRALVVDDEGLAREGLRVLLERDDGVTCVGECRNGEEAVREIRSREPDLVFLDVQMPGMDGFEVLDELEPEETPMVVFVTAYDEYAIMAFEVRALDYLLKPYDDDRFFRTLERVKEEIAHRETAEFARRLADLLENRGDGDGEHGPRPGASVGDEPLEGDVVELARARAAGLWMTGERQATLRRLARPRSRRC